MITKKLSENYLVGLNYAYYGKFGETTRGD